MRKIDLADASFLMLEKRATPMHVAGLVLGTLPDNVTQRTFMKRLDGIFRNVDEFRKPFGEYVTTGKTGILGGLQWETDAELDFDYHVRHSALPKPGRYRELFALVSRLHGTLLDRSRPLWEVHLIEGLQDRQFAVYLKMHHATIDGISGMQLINNFCSTNKKKQIKYSPLSIAAEQQMKEAVLQRRPRKIVPRKSEVNTVFEALKQQYDSSINLAGVAGEFARTWLGYGSGLSVPFFKVPQSTIRWT